MDPARDPLPGNIGAHGLSVCRPIAALAAVEVMLDGDPDKAGDRLKRLTWLAEELMANGMGIDEAFARAAKEIMA